MKISVIGAGNIGGTLGSKWAARGHEVTFGVRDPEAAKVKSLLAKAGRQARAASINAAVGSGDVVVFAVPSRVMAETIAQLSDQLNGHLLIDTTNNVGRAAMHSLDLLQQAAPNSPLFRAFSNLGWENFADPIVGGLQADLFYCGTGGEGQAVVDRLISDIGLRPIYLGGLDKAGIIDALTHLWFTLVQQGRGRHLALKMISD